MKILQYIHTYIHTYIHIYMYIHTFIHIYLCIHIMNSFLVTIPHSADTFIVSVRGSLFSAIFAKFRRKNGVFLVHLSPAGGFREGPNDFNIFINCSTFWTLTSIFNFCLCIEEGLLFSSSQL
jgi:hypothetical protein